MLHNTHDGVSELLNLCGELICMLQEIHHHQEQESGCQKGFTIGSQSVNAEICDGKQRSDREDLSWRQLSEQISENGNACQSLGMNHTENEEINHYTNDDGGDQILKKLAHQPALLS